MWLDRKKQNRMNNTAILKKCLEELSKDSPRLDYLRGMLETLVEMQNNFYISPLIPKGQMIETNPFAFSHGTPTTSANTTELDEAAILDQQARAAIEKVKAMSTEWKNLLKN